MVGTSISIEVESDEVVRAFGVLAALMSDLTPVMDAIGSAMEASVDRRFETGLGPYGIPWLPSERAVEENGMTLVESARLRNSISHLASATDVVVGTNVIYAGIHQFGGTIRREARTQTIYRRYDARTGEISRRFVKKGRSNFAQDVAVGAVSIAMPARPFLGFDDGDWIAVQEIVGNAITRATGRPS